MLFSIFFLVGLLNLGLMVILEKSAVAKYESLVKANSLLALGNQYFAFIKDAETGQRGFILTRQEEYLPPYYSGVKNAQAILESLNQTEFDDETHRLLFQRVNNLTLQKLDELQLTIKLTKQGNIDEALAIITSNIGREFMTNIRLEISSFNEDVTTFVAKTESDYLLLQKTIRYVFIVESIAIIILLMFVGWSGQKALINPIANLTKAASHFRLNGKFNILQNTSVDEIDQLISAFNQMGLQINESIESLANERNLLTKAVQETNSGIVITDPNRNVLWTNRAFEDMTGYSFSEVTGQNLKNFLHGDQTDNLTVNEIKRCLQVNQPVDVEILNYHKTGRRYWNHLKITPIVEQGAVTHYVGIQHDISKQKAADSRAVDAMAKFRELVEFLPVGIYTTDPEGMCTFVNPYWSDMAGFDTQMAKGTGWYNAVHEDDRDYVTKNWSRMVQAKGKWGAEYRFQNRDGTIYDVYGIATEIVDEEGEIKGYLGVNLDVTERKFLRDKINHFEKMESVGQLAGGIAHDFNNQLAGIIGLAEIIKNKSSDNSILEYSENIIQIVDRASDLTSKLLAFSRQTPTNIKLLNIHDIIDETLSILAHTIDKRIHITTDLQAQTPFVNGDASLLQNALLNLGVNARDAMPNGGTLHYSTVNASHDSSHELIRDSLLSEGEYVVIKVTDSGTGMTSEIQSKVFEPFYTTKAPGKGTGMGLSSVYGTVKEHEGSISIVSDIGQGTELTIYLPVELDHEAIEAAEPNQHIQQETGPLTILLADDEEQIRAISAEFLTLAGHTVIEASNGEEALEKYIQHQNDIRLLILDINMPKRNGLECYDDIYQLNPKIDAIFCTGFANKADITKIHSRGLEHIVQKPYRMNDLIDTVASLHSGRPPRH